ncbi:NADP dehydrogenase [ubiquinone] 1 subunit c2 [Plakobranchus ocellatus]|uniref:NADP dehydrogenase [ubiquinone] 1 subunit c2 n=1 Tax=Plakobranchus ocellatus TaxID=259542 RepID=A0AAV3YDF8_9GAST|nr:NADP dehydrogenase [ubiquinone] 1 subunit c2 [Plakobranchus ocellatus]
MTALTLNCNSSLGKNRCGWILYPIFLQFDVNHYQNLPLLDRVLGGTGPNIKRSTMYGPEITKKLPYNESLKITLIQGSIGTLFLGLSVYHNLHTRRPPNVLLLKHAAAAAVGLFAGKQLEKLVEERRNLRVRVIEDYIAQHPEDFPVTEPKKYKDLLLKCPQQGDLRLSGPPSGQDAGGGARTRDRRVPADLRADSLATVPPTPPIKLMKTIFAKSPNASISIDAAPLRSQARVIKSKTYDSSHSSFLAYMVIDKNVVSLN